MVRLSSVVGGLLGAAAIALLLLVVLAAQHRPADATAALLAGGRAALAVGDYATAYQRLKPLAARGVPDAQGLAAIAATQGRSCDRPALRLAAATGDCGSRIRIGLARVAEPPVGW